MNNPANPTPPFILVVEDEGPLREMMVYNLQAEGFEVEGVPSGEEALERLQDRPADFIILDIMLPGMSGFEVLHSLRQRGAKVPVLVLTARTGDADRVQGLTLGADDYLGKPFSFLELMARVRAILRRSAPSDALPREVATGPFRINFVQLAVFRGRTDLGLSLKEFRILEALVSNPGRVHSRRELLNMAWDTDARPSPRTVDVHMVSLRKKLCDTEMPPMIQTLEREGYRWTLPVRK